MTARELAAEVLGGLLLMGGLVAVVWGVFAL